MSTYIERTPSATMRSSKRKRLDSIGIRAPDGGWGWVVAASACFIQALLPTILASFGVIFAELIESYGMHSTEAAWIPAIFSATWCLGTPWASMMSEYFGHRSLAMFGGLSGSVGLMLSSCTTNLIALCFTYGVLGGLGTAFTVSQSTIIIQKYFRRRRGTATGIFMSGGSLGQLALPSLLRYLLSEYGYSGAVLLHGGIVLHSLVAAMMYHPVEQHLLPEPEEETTSVDKEPSLSSSAEGEELCKNFLKDQAMSNIALLSNNKDGPTKDNGDVLHVAVTQPENKSGHTTWRKVKRVLGEVYAFRFLADPVFVIVAVSNLCGRMTFQNFLLVIPSLGRQLGVSKEESALLLTVSAVTDWAARFGMPALSDLKVIRTKYLFIIGSLACSIGCIMASVAQEHVAMLVSSAVFGFGSGSLTGLTYVLLSEYMGLENLPPAYGMCFLVNGIGAFTITPLMGFIRDLTGDFRDCLRFLAAFIWIAIIAWVLEPLAMRHNKKKLQRQQAAAAEVEEEKDKTGVEV